MEGSALNGTLDSNREDPTLITSCAGILNPYMTCYLPESIKSRICSVLTFIRTADFALYEEIRMSKTASARHTGRQYLSTAAVESPLSSLGRNHPHTLKKREHRFFGRTSYWYRVKVSIQPPTAPPRYQERVRYLERLKALRDRRKRPWQFLRAVNNGKCHMRLQRSSMTFRNSGD